MATEGFMRWALVFADFVRRCYDVEGRARVRFGARVNGVARTRRWRQLVFVPAPTAFCALKIGPEAVAACARSNLLCELCQGWGSRPLLMRA